MPMPLKYGKLMILFMAVSLLVLLAWYYDISSVVVYRTQTYRSYFFNRLAGAGLFLSEFKRTKSLTEENLKLKNNILALENRIAEISEAERQNDFLREALNLPARIRKSLVDGGIFNVTFMPEGHRLLVNRGKMDGVKKDDPVITSSGILIGLIEQAHEYYAEVIGVTNINFKATVQVVGRDTAGIMRGGLEQGLILDFISHNDELTEGDIIATNGSDLLPVGLILGKVKTIGDEDGNVFKKVLVKPMTDESDFRNVLIIGR